MRVPFTSLLVALGLAACNHTAPADASASADSLATAAGISAAADSATGSPPQQPRQAMANATDTPENAPYRLLGVLDPDRRNMVAFALKVPRGWQVTQSFKRRWRGATPQNEVYLSLRAPDGRAQIEYLPTAMHVYADGPMTQQNRAMAQQMGLPTRTADNELPPMPVVAYLRQYVLPQLAQHGLALGQPGHEQQTAPQREPDGRLTSHGSVDGVLPNGHHARVEGRMTLMSQQFNGETFYSWSVTPWLTQTADDLEAAYAHTRVAQESIVPNPAWQQLEQQTQQQGAQANSAASRQQHEATMGQIAGNTAAMTRAHEARMGDIARQGAANTARHNARMDAMDTDKAAFDQRMAAGDRQQEIRVDGIREVAKYEDPATGERVKVAEGYQHVYRDRQQPTSYYGSNTPIDGGRLDWEELQRVSLKDY